MADLREETIKGILKEEAFAMEVWGNAKQLVETKGEVSCGTACCIAGHIVAAALRLNLPLPSVFDPTAHWDGRIPETARELWASQYGTEEARRLDFSEGWSNDLENVTPQQAIDHLNGAPAVCNDDEDDDDSSEFDF